MSDYTPSTERVARYRVLDSWPPTSDGHEPTNEELIDIRAEQDALWAVMTDAERAEAGAPRVQCALCDVDYGRSCVGSPTQAHGCASVLAFKSDPTGPDGARLYLTCHYGSSRDGTAYEVVLPSYPGQHPPRIAADPVCDGCIDVYDACGLLVEVGDFLHDPAVAEKVFKRP